MSTNHPMTPLEAAQSIIEARARATQGEWDARYIASACGMHESNAKFTAITANHAAAVAQAYIDSEKRKMNDDMICPVCDMQMYIEVQPSMGDEGDETQEILRCSHCQLREEKKRVAELVELVSTAYQEGWEWGRKWDADNGRFQAAEPYTRSHTKQELARIMGKETHDDA
jgi:hypothetical protein